MIFTGEPLTKRLKEEKSKYSVSSSNVCAKHGEKVKVPLSDGWMRCPIEGCLYTR